MNIEATVERRDAFAVDAESIKKVWMILSELSGPDLKADISCSDNVVRKFNDMGTLVNYENPLGASIRSIDFFAYASARNHCHLTLTDGSRTTILLKIEGEENSVLQARNKLVDVFEGMRVNYSLFTRPGFPFALSALLAYLSGWGVESLIKHLLKRNAIDPSSNKALLTGAFSLVVLIVLLFSTGTLERVLRRLFPPVSFKIGQGAKRFERSERLRYFVLITTLLALALSVVGSIVATLLMRG